jgi:hypothetical protein
MLLSPDPSRDVLHAAGGSMRVGMVEDVECVGAVSVELKVHAAVAIPDRNRYCVGVRVPPKGHVHAVVEAVCEFPMCSMRGDGGCHVLSLP